MKYEVQNYSITGRTHPFTHKPQPDLPIWRVIRMDDGQAMGAHATREDAEIHAAELNAAMAGISLEESLRSDAEND